MSRPRVRAAQRKIARAAALAADTEASRVASKVYDATVRVQASANPGGPPLWLLGTLEFLGEEIGARLARARGVTDPAEAAYVAAYVSSGVYNLLAAMLTEWAPDDEHYRVWRERDVDGEEGPAVGGATASERDSAQAGVAEAGGPRRDDGPGGVRGAS